MDKVDLDEEKYISRKVTAYLDKTKISKSKE